MDDYFRNSVFFHLPVSLEVCWVGLLGVRSGLIVGFGKKVVRVESLLRPDVPDGGVGVGGGGPGDVVGPLFVIVILLVVESFSALAGMYFPQHLNSIYCLMEIKGDRIDQIINM